MQFDAKTIREFVTVAGLGSFSRAAEELAIAQPWLSSRIRRLEDELGCRLFDRSRRRITLTEAGERLLEPAQRFLRAADHLAATAKSLGQVSGTLIIGSSFAAIGVPERDRLIEEFIACKPQVRVRVESLPGEQIAQALQRGDLDVAFLHDPLPAHVKPGDALPLSTQFAVLLLPEESPLAALPCITPKALAGLEIAVFPEENAPGLCGPIYASLRQSGAILKEVPEISFTSLERFAARRRIAALSVDTMTPVLAAVHRLVARPLQGSRFSATLYLMRPAADATNSAHSFWRFAQSIQNPAASPKKSTSERFSINSDRI